MPRDELDNHDCLSLVRENLAKKKREAEKQRKVQGLLVPRCEKKHLMKRQEGEGFWDMSKC